MLIVRINWLLILNKVRSSMSSETSLGELLPVKLISVFLVHQNLEYAKIGNLFLVLYVHMIEGSNILLTTVC